MCIFVCSCIYVLALVSIHHHHHHHHLPQPHQQVSFKKKSIVVVSPWFTFSFPLPWVWGPPWIQEHCKVSFDKFLICFNPISWSPGTCGRALVLERIVGGQNAELGQYPWLVNLGYTRKAGNWKWIIFFKSSVGNSMGPDFNPPKPDSLEATKDNNFTKAHQPKFNCGGTLIGPRFLFCPTESFSSSLPLYWASQAVRKYCKYCKYCRIILTAAHCVVGLPASYKLWVTRVWDSHAS